MSLKIQHLSLGPLETNAVVIVNEENKEVIVVDPSFNPKPLLGWAEDEGLKISQIWITHGHADHTAGVPELMRALPEKPELLITKEAYEMTKRQGNQFYGMPLEPLPEPTRFLEHGEKLSMAGIDEPIAEVRFAPGHAPGSVVFYLAKEGVAIVGDLIFKQSVGRWDFEGGDFGVLTRSIREQVFTLPDETVLIPGHGPSTTVGWEKSNNPYVN